MDDRHLLRTHADYAVRVVISSFLLETDLDTGADHRALRVLMIGDFPASLDRPRGGVEAVACNLAFGLVGAGVDLTVIRFGNTAEGGPTAAPFEIIDVPRRRPGSLGNWLVSPREIRRIVDRIQPDVVHLEGTAELYRGPFPPSVLTIHGIPYRDAVHGTGFARRLLQPLLLRLSFEESIRKHRNVIVINQMVRKELGERKNIVFHDIPNPVEDGFFEIERHPVAGRVLYVGVLNRRKNITGLIESAALARKSCPGLELRLAGPFLDDYESTIRDAVESTCMQEATRFLGSLSRAEVIDELASCSCFALASLQESAPMAIAEAMAAGVPVVSSLVGGIGTMIDHGITGLTSPVGDANAFAANLEAILTDDSRRDQIGDVARKAAENVYRMKRIVERTCDVYRCVIEQSVS
jgi:glycosyltransferase involved in cell wall biosynthesis